MSIVIIEICRLMACLHNTKNKLMKRESLLVINIKCVGWQCSIQSMPLSMSADLHSGIFFIDIL